MAYLITLTVRDSAGLTATRTLDVTPNVANITLRTKPMRGTLTIDGQPVANGTVIPSVVGFKRPIGAPATQTINGLNYTFRSWSDGGAATHTISTPLANTTYTADYKVTRDSSASGRSLLAALRLKNASGNQGNRTGSGRRVSLRLRLPTVCSVRIPPLGA